MEKALREARRRSLLTQEEMGKKVGKSVITISNYEKSAEHMTLATLREWYQACDTAGKEAIKDQLVIFLAED